MDKRWTVISFDGKNNKGEAASIPLRCYHRHQRMSGYAERIETIAIGDSINDAPLLAMVDYPFLVQKPDGSYDPDPSVRNDSSAWTRAGRME